MPCSRRLQMARRCCRPRRHRRLRTCLGWVRPAVLSRRRSRRNRQAVAAAWRGRWGYTAIGYCRAHLLENHQPSSFGLADASAAGWARPSRVDSVWRGANVGAAHEHDGPTLAGRPLARQWAHSSVLCSVSPSIVSSARSSLPHPRSPLPQSPTRTSFPHPPLSNSLRPNHLNHCSLTRTRARSKLSGMRSSASERHRGSKREGKREWRGRRKVQGGWGGEGCGFD